LKAPFVLDLHLPEVGGQVSLCLALSSSSWLMMFLSNFTPLTEILNNFRPLPPDRAALGGPSILAMRSPSFTVALFQADPLDPPHPQRPERPATLLSRADQDVSWEQVQRDGTLTALF
jgi:hypothetical protein